MDSGDVGQLLIGFVLPLVFGVILQSKWSSAVKQVITFILYMLASVFVWIYASPDPGLDDWRGYVAVLANIIMGGLAGYFALMNRAVLPKLEKATDLPVGDGK